MAVMVLKDACLLGQESIPIFHSFIRFFAPSRSKFNLDAIISVSIASNLRSVNMSSSKQIFNRRYFTFLIKNTKYFSKSTLSFGFRTVGRCRRLHFYFILFFAVLIEDTSIALSDLHFDSREVYCFSFM